MAGLAGTLPGVDLYKAAREFPRTLQGRGTLISSVQIADGGISRGTLYGSRVRGRAIRMHHGLYLVGVAEPDLLDRARAALAVSPPGTVVGYQTAAAMQGFGVAEDEDIHLVAPPDSRFSQCRGIAAHRPALAVPRAVRVHGIPCTPPARTAIDLARTLDQSLALATLDCVLHNRVCGRDALTAEVARHRGLPDVEQARTLLTKADGRSVCTQETMLRSIIHTAGLLEFVPQFEVRQGGRRYVLDLADPRHMVAAEYDGVSHDEPSRRVDDRERHNWLDGLGWRMRYFTARDIYVRPWKVISDIRTALNLASSR